MIYLEVYKRNYFELVNDDYEQKVLNKPLQVILSIILGDVINEVMTDCIKIKEMRNKLVRRFSLNYRKGITITEVVVYRYYLVKIISLKNEMNLGSIEKEDVKGINMFKISVYCCNFGTIKLLIVR